MNFISAPDVDFDINGNLIDLSAASVWTNTRLALSDGVHRITTANAVSAPFTTGGTNAVLGGTVAGGESRSFLIVPAANFSGDTLTSLSGGVLSQSLTVTGLLGNTSYRALVLAQAATAFRTGPPPVPEQITSGMWALVAISGGLRVDLAQYPANNGTAITSIEYRIDGGSAVTLAASGLITTTGSKSVELRAINATGAAAWSDLKTRTALATAVDMPTLRVAHTDYNSGNSDNTSYTFNAPAGRVVGDTLFVFSNVDGSPTVTASAGWTIIRQDVQAYAAGGKCVLLSKAVDGTSADNLVLTLSVAENFAAKMWCFVGGCEVVTTAPLNPTGGAAVPVDAPSLSLDRVRDSKWFVCLGYSGGRAALATGTEPAGYTYEGVGLGTSTFGSGVRVFVAARDLTVQTENPGVFAIGIDQTLVYTVAIYNTASAALAPTLTDAPLLSGYGVAGTNIEVVDDTWSGAATSQRRYFKNSEAVDISTAYQISSTASVGEAYTAQVEATSAAAVSTGWQAVDDSITVGTGPVLLATGSIIGQPAVGVLLSLAGFQFAGAFALEYRWLRNGTPILGATDIEYRTQLADQDNTITADVRAQDVEGRWSERFAANGTLLVQPPPTAPPDAFTSGQAEAFDVPSVGGSTIGISVLVEPNANGATITRLWAEFNSGTGYGSLAWVPYSGIGDYQFTVPAGPAYTPRVWLENASGEGVKFILNAIDPSTITASTTNQTSVTFSGATFTISAPGTTGVGVPVGYSVDGVPYVVGEFDIVSDPTPAYVVPTSGTDLGRGKNGYQKDPVRSTNQRWDSRINASFTTPTETFPLRMTPGSVFVKAVSRDNVTVSVSDTGDGVVINYAQIDCVSAAPGPNRFSSPAIWPTPASRPLIEVDVDAIYATLPSYSTTGHSTVTWADVAFYINKHEIIFGKIDGPVRGNGYESAVPYQFGPVSNYGLYVEYVMNGLALGLLGDNWSAADKKAAIKRIVQLGSHWYWGFKSGSAVLGPNGGHYQFSQMVMLLALKWSGYTSEYAYFHTNLSGNFWQALRTTIAVRKGIFTPHTGRERLLDWPVARKRLSQSVAGNVVSLAFDRSGAGGGPDGSNLNVFGLLMVHDLTGETRRILSNFAITPTSGTVSYRDLTVESEFTSAVAGDLFYFRPNYTINNWDMLWSIGTDPGNFMGNATAPYFSLQAWTSQLLAVVALGVPVPPYSPLEKAIRLVMRANLANIPSPVENFPEFMRNAVTSSGALTDWPADFYTSHGATILAPWLTADVIAPVISGVSSTAVSAGASTVTLTTDTAEGGVFWVVYASGGSTPSAAQILAGQNASGVAALASGALDVSATGTVTVPATGVASTNVLAILHQDFSNNNSNILTRTL